LKPNIEIGLTTTLSGFAGKQAKEICSWRKLEEAKTMSRCFSLKPLKLLALPRGIEPLFQP
jgi:hypothetical protein